MPDNEKAINGEILIDTGSVCVGIERYDELVKAEEKLKIIEKLYLGDTSSYNYEYVLKLIFGEKGDKENA